jgi:hypothetical protein
MFGVVLRASRIGLMVAAMLLVAAGGRVVRADDPPAFVLSRLSVADELLDLQAEDLNADGLKDILIVHRKGLPPEETRWVSIFLQSSTGGFSAAANQSWELDSAAAVLECWTWAMSPVMPAWRSVISPGVRFATIP